jgi:predicted nucleic acid-binding protein
MAALRCLIDSMVFDAIADEDLLPTVDRLTSAHALELLADVVGIAQVAAIPDPARRKRLQRVRVLVVPPVGERDPVVAALRAERGIDREDALVAAAAAAQGVPLVTEDRALRAAVAHRLPGTPCWTWAGDLRPRLRELDAQPR